MIHTSCNRWDKTCNGAPSGIFRLCAIILAYQCVQRPFEPGSPTIFFSLSAFPANSNLSVWNRKAGILGRSRRTGRPNLIIKEPLYYPSSRRFSTLPIIKSLISRISMPFSGFVSGVSQRIIFSAYWGGISGGILRSIAMI